MRVQTGIGAAGNVPGTDIVRRTWKLFPARGEDGRSSMRMNFLVPPLIGGVPRLISTVGEVIWDISADFMIEVR